MVLLDGVPSYACTLGASACAGRAVATVEELVTPAAPHPLQSAFLAEQAGQCGYCLSGILVSAAALRRATGHRRRPRSARRWSRISAVAAATTDHPRGAAGGAGDADAIRSSQGGAEPGTGDVERMARP